MSAHMGKGRTRIGVLLATGLALVGSAPRVAPAQGVDTYHPASDPAAVAIHERYLKTVGGLQKRTKYSHTVVEMDVNGKTVMRSETFAMQPDKLRMTSTAALTNTIMFDFGFDGTTGWANSPMTGLARLSGTELEAMRSVVKLMSSPPVDSTYALKTVGRQQLEGEQVDAVMLASTAGDTIITYYAVASGLLVASRGRTVRGERVDSTVTHFGGWQRQGTRLAFTTMSVKGPAGEMVTRIVRNDDSPFDSARFKPPEGLPAEPIGPLVSPKKP